MNNKYISKIFDLYADSWFEVKKFIDSIKLLLDLEKYDFTTKLTKINIKEYRYSFNFEYRNKMFNLIFNCYGKYKDNSNINEIESMLKNGGKPDLVFFENKKIILGIEDTDTSQVGNASLQRMERIDFFIKNRIPFLYITYYLSFDRSQNKKQKRKPLSNQLIFFEKNKIDILYKINQDIDNNEDNLLMSKYFFNKILGFNFEIKNQDKIKEKIKKETSYKDLISFYEENIVWDWKPKFLNDSPILKELYINKKIYTFSRKKIQKVGFVKFKDLIEVLNKFNLKINFQAKNEDFILINPVMFVQKKGNETVKVDPATGEFVFYNNLFDKFKNLTLIYSPNASKKIIMKSKTKLSHHIKDKSNFIIISNINENTIIENNNLLDYDNFKKNDKANEDDLDFILYNFMESKNFESLYISAPCASWSRVLYNRKKILDISKNDIRPDYIFINHEKKIILIGESKERYIDLLKYRSKHEKTFNIFVNKMKKTNLFINYKFVELNICYLKNHESPNFNLIGIILNTDGTYKIQYFIKNNTNILNLFFYNK